jgi:pyrimidine deaminase RibD-like protein
VNDGQVLATAVTAQGGRPHAETEALASIGELARAATVYRDSREAKDFESFVENEAL